MRENETGLALEMTGKELCYAVKNNRFKDTATRTMYFPHMHSLNGGKWTFLKFPCLKALVESYGIDTTTREVDKTWIVDYQ